MAADAVPLPPPPAADQSRAPGNGLGVDQSGIQSEGLFARVSNNPFLTAGIGLAGLGIVLTSAQKGLRYGATALKRRLLVDVEINVKDESYEWFLHWMTVHQRNQLTPLGAKILPSSVNGERRGILGAIIQRINPRLHHLSISTKKFEHPNGAVSTKFSLLPGQGRHLLRYKDAFIMVDRVRETKSMDLQMGRPWETISLTTLYSHRHIFEDLFSEAHVLAQQSTEGKLIVYMSKGAFWEKFGQPRPKRPLESVVLDQGVKESALSDIKDFLSSRKWYHDRGIPYRRGYLLHGPPGSGKSSFVQALAGELDYSIAMLNLGERGLTDDRLNHLLSIIPPRSLVLLEDADAAFNNRRTQTDADGYRGAHVTFSGLLNALDGVASAEERILFLTTNHPERLDSALVRPGRVDMMLHLGYATRWQAGQLWDRFYGGLDADGQCRERFLDQLDKLGVSEKDHGSDSGTVRGVSTAALQGLFLYNKDNMEGAIQMAHEHLARLVAQQNDTAVEVAQRSVAGS